MKQCLECGSQLKDDEEFCNKCGTALNNNTEEKSKNIFDKYKLNDTANTNGTGYWAATNAAKEGLNKADYKFFIGTNYTPIVQSHQQGSKSDSSKAPKLIKFSNAVIAFIIALVIGAGIGLLCANIIVPAIIESQTLSYNYNGSKWQQKDIDEADFKVIYNEVCNSWKQDPTNFSQFKSVQEYMDYMLDTIESEITQYGDTLASTYGITDLKSYIAFYAQQLQASSSMSSGASSSGSNTNSGSSDASSSSESSTSK